MKHKHNYEISDIDPELDRVRFTCCVENCGVEYMISYKQYQMAHGVLEDDDN